MTITISNQAQLPKRYLRFMKWKFFNLKDKFQRLIYVEVFLDTEGQSPKMYTANIRLGIPGHDIIIRNRSKDLTELLRKSYNAVHRYLAKNKEPKSIKINEVLF